MYADTDAMPPAKRLPTTAAAPPADQPPRPRFGAHLSIAGGLHLALLAARDARMDCVQIFVRNQRQWAAKPITPAQADEFQHIRRTTGITPVVAHASYLLNLATTDRTQAARTCRALLDELDRCNSLGVDGLVLHPGAALGRPIGQACRRVARALRATLDRAGEGPTRILLETTAGQGTTLGHTFEQLAEIITHAGCGTRIGVCLDTCHLFAAGYDFRTEQGYREMMASLDRTVGLSRVACIHANDSKGGLGSRIDRHEHIGRGCIGRRGFAHFVRDPLFAGMPMILETPKGTDARGRDLDRVNIACLRRLARCEPGLC